MTRTKNQILSVALALALLISVMTACSSKESLPQTEGELWLGNVRIDGAGEMARPSLAVDISASFERLVGADVGVIGEFIEDCRNGFGYAEWSDGVPIPNRYGIAFNRFLVTEVLYGDIKPGEIITLTYNYAVFENRLQMWDDSTPMHKGDRWIVFANQFDTEETLEVFELWGHELGISVAKSEQIYGAYRYPLPDAALSQAARTRIFDGIDTAALGVYNRGAFDFRLYAEILEHFEIGVRDWTNPGRDFDVRMIEMIEMSRQR
jgi:hypothetical protein